MTGDFGEPTVYLLNVSSAHHGSTGLSLFVTQKGAANQNAPTGDLVVPPSSTPFSGITDSKSGSQWIGETGGWRKSHIGLL
jgi:hypothetical protein